MAKTKTKKNKESKKVPDKEEKTPDFQNLDDYEKELTGKDLESFRFWRNQYTKRQQRRISYNKAKDVNCTICGKNHSVFRTGSSGILTYFKCRLCDFTFKAVKN